jgi:hypothetical protein
LHSLHIKSFFKKLLLRVLRKIIKYSYSISEKTENILCNILIANSSGKDIYKDILNISNNLQIMDLFFQQSRFDIVFKLFYVKWAFITKSDFPKHVYLSHIFSFIKDEPYKKQPIEILNSFNKLLNNIKEKGFDKNYPLLINPNGELVDGAHRFVSAMITNSEITTVVSNNNKNINYNYSFFNNKRISRDISDLNACLYVPMNPCARIFLLHSVASTQYDNLVRNILNKYGFIYYENALCLTYNGYVNLVKINYGRDMNNQWIGTQLNDYKGLRIHAFNSFANGKNPLRIFVWVCENEQYIIDAKKEIRSFYNAGNYSCHSSDTHEEAIELAQTFFNQNSLYYLNNRPYWLTNYEFDNYVENLKHDLTSQNLSLQAFCACGSTPMNVFGIRKADDLDFMCLDTFDALLSDCVIRHPASNHLNMSNFYELHKDEIILNPKYHFYYRGLKFITLDILLQFKTNRNEQPKDINDCNLICEFKSKAWNG